jgi:hypothetical protein
MPWPVACKPSAGLIKTVTGVGAGGHRPLHGRGHVGGHVRGAGQRGRAPAAKRAGGQLAGQGHDRGPSFRADSRRPGLTGSHSRCGAPSERMATDRAGRSPTATPPGPAASVPKITGEDPRRAARPFPARARTTLRSMLDDLLQHEPRIDRTVHHDIHTPLRRQPHRTLNTTSTRHLHCGATVERQCLGATRMTVGVTPALIASLASPSAMRGAAPDDEWAGVIQS